MGAAHTHPQRVHQRPHNFVNVDRPEKRLNHERESAFVADSSNLPLPRRFK